MRERTAHVAQPATSAKRKQKLSQKPTVEEVAKEWLTYLEENGRTESTIKNNNTQTSKKEIQTMTTLDQARKTLEEAIQNYATIQAQTNHEQPGYIGDYIVIYASNIIDTNNETKTGYGYISDSFPHQLLGLVNIADTLITEEI